MQASATRALFGFMAAAISVLVFHQAMWEVLHLLALPGMGMSAPYLTDPIAPSGAPRIINLCFWGGLYGIVFGLMPPRLTAPLWLCGLALGWLIRFTSRLNNRVAAWGGAGVVCHVRPKRILPCGDCGAIMIESRPPARLELYPRLWHESCWFNKRDWRR